MKLRLILLAAALTAPVSEAALACSCLPQTLQQRFDAADSIAVVRVTGCASGRADKRGVCPDSRWVFEIEDVLKGSPKPGAFGGITSCDLTSEPGAKHLLFMDKGGNAGVCTSRTLDGPGAAFGMQDVALLREYRDDLAVDLSEPWTFRDTGQACTIEHAFGPAAIQFVYLYGNGSDVAVGGDVFFRQPTAVVWHTPVLGVTPMRLSVAGEQYRLAPHAVQRLPDMRLDPMYSASSLIQGGSTLKLLEKMKAMPVDVVVSGDGTGSAQQAAGPRSFRAETRTARLPGAADRFRNCVDSRESRKGV